MSGRFHWLWNAYVITAFTAVLSGIALFALLYLFHVSWHLILLSEAIVFLITAIAMLVIKLRRIYAGNQIEKAIKKEADAAVLAAPSERRGEVQVLRSRLLAAIETLRKSQLGRVRGRAALYELPWYLIVGHPAAGKSSAITHSGLTFPFADKGNAAVQGIGGTRNCDWFFTTEGVLLDTAGRYTTMKEDRQEWLGFLKLLKRYRRRAPINGAVVVISLSEILEQGEEALRQYAHQVRERIHEMDASFGVKVPTYFVFTKLDLLPGFSDFFADASQQEQNSVWGFSFDLQPSQPQKALPERVSDEFDLLVSGLEHYATERLLATRAQSRRSELFLFPREFSSLRTAIVRFINLLIENNPYHAQALVRGLYFSSALQGAETRCGIQHAVAKRFQLKLTENKQSTAPRGYFLRDLFSEVLFADQHLMAWMARRRTWIRRAVGMGVCTIAAALCLSAFLVSFFANQQRLDEERRILWRYDEAAIAGGFNAQVDRLNYVVERLAQIQKERQDGMPWYYRLGLNQNTKVQEILRERIVREGHQLIVTESNVLLQRNLQHPSLPPSHGPLRDWQACYDNLKLHLLLSEQKPHDREALQQLLASEWQILLQSRSTSPLSDGALQQAKRVSDTFVNVALSQSWQAQPVNQKLVHLTRQHLLSELRGQIGNIEHLYASIKQSAANRFSPIGLQDALKGKDVELYNAPAPVAGIFSDKAWNTYVKAALLAAAAGGGDSEDWVLAAPRNPGRMAGMEGSQFQLELLKRYHLDRQLAWQTFLLSTQLKPTTTAEATLKSLQRLADRETSPTKRLIMFVLQESGTKLNVVDKALFKNDIQNVPLLDNLALLTTVDSQGKISFDDYFLALNRLQERFAGVAGASQPGSVARQLVVQTLNGSGSEINVLQQFLSQRLDNRIPERERDALGRVLMAPAAMAYQSSNDLLAGELNRVWSSEVYAGWQQLHQRFPFSPSDNEAAINDVTRLLRPNDGALLKFHQSWIADLVTLRNGHWVPRSFGNSSVRLHPSYLSALETLERHGRLTFGTGSNDSFQLEFQPVPAPGMSELLLEIDGQAIRYRNGPQNWSGLQWPGSGTTGASLRATTFAGAPVAIASFNGRMGLIRLLLQAQSQSQADGTVILSWAVPGNANSKVQMKMRAISGGNPLGYAYLRQIELPNKVVL